jgi:hypothetical protein
VNELEWVVIKFMACQMSVCELSRIDECELLLSNVHNSFFFLSFCYYYSYFSDV